MADTSPSSAPSKAIVFARRSGSTVVLWVVVAAVFASRWSWAYLGLVGGLTLCATAEYFRMLGVAEVRCFPRFGMAVAAGYCGTLCAFLLNGHPPPPDLDGLAVFIALAGAFALQLRRPLHGMECLQAVAANLLGFVYIALLFNFTTRVIFLDPAWKEAPWQVSGHGAMLLLWLVSVTKFTDMGAYLTGSMIGRHKMIPHVSPGKTWEGFGGALVFSQLAGCGLFAAFPHELSVLHSWGHVIALGFLLAVLAVIGDLAESVLKRALNAKDSGRMLPGIGGAMDLIDSLCFTAPALYFYLKWLPLPTA
jgi:phosphatidate cytidylyltransferase